MNDAATFFRDRSNDEGETYHFEMGARRVSVYAQKPLSSLQKQDGKLSYDWDVLRRDVAQAGGGVIVAVADEQGGRVVNFVKVAGKGYTPPDECVVLAPGRPPHPWKVQSGNADGTKSKWPAGSHLLVPVDQPSGEQLQGFIGYLGWLSPDIESLVLYAIRRPSLDTRLDRVETTLLGQTHDEAMAAANARGFARWKNRFAQWAASPVVRVASAMLLVLLLGANGALFYRVQNQLAAKEATTTGVQPGADSKEKAHSKETNITPKNVEGIVDDAKVLFEHLRSAKDPNLAALQKAHFTSLDLRKLDEALRPRKAGEQGPGNRPVLWGLFKLQLLALDPDPDDTAFLKQWEEITLTKDAYRAIPPEILDAHPDDVRMLAAIACRMGYVEGTPTLKETALRGQVSPAVVIPGDCGVSDAEVEKGLQALDKFVEARE